MPATRRKLPPILEQLEERLAPAAGALDGTFGNGGKVSFPFVDESDSLSDLAIDAAGRLVAVGRTTGPDQQFRLARFLPNGAPDPDFGSAGKVSTSGFDPRPGVEADAVSDAVAVGTGTVVVAGHANRSADLAIAKYTDTGAFVKQVTLDFDANTEGYLVHKVAVDPAGQVLVTGYLQTFQGGTFVGQVFVLRLNADLTVDEQYGVQGRFVSTLTAAESVFYPLDMDLAVLADGASLVTVATRDPSTSNEVFTVLRIDNQGRADLGFGTAGKVSDNLGAASNIARPAGLVVQSSGAIVVAGVVVEVAAFTAKFALVRFTADGRLDDTFGDAGRTITSFGPDRAATARALALLPTGQLVVVGSVLDGDAIDFALARYSADGRLDGNFGIAGLVVSDISGGTDEAVAVVVQPNRGLVVAGTGIDPDGDANFALARYSGLGITTLTLVPQAARVDVNTETLLKVTVQTDGVPLADLHVVLSYLDDNLQPTASLLFTDALGQANFPRTEVTPGVREYSAKVLEFGNLKASCNVEWVVPSPRGLQVSVRNTSPDGFDLDTAPDTFFPAVFSLFGQYRANLTIRVLYDGVPVPGLSGRFIPDDKSTPDIDEFVPAQVQLKSTAQRAEPPLEVKAFQILPNTDAQGETTFSYSSSIAHTDSFEVVVTYNGQSTPVEVPFRFEWFEPIPELQIEYGFDYGSGDLIIKAYLYSDHGAGNRLPSSGVPLVLEVVKGAEKGIALRTEITDASGFATFTYPRKNLHRFVGNLFETIQVTPVNAALASKLKRVMPQSFPTLRATEAPVSADTANGFQSPLTKDVYLLPDLTLGPLHATPTVGEEVLLPVAFGLDPKLTATGPRHNLGDGDEAVVFKYLFRARPAGEPTDPIVSASDFGVLRSSTPGTDVVYAEVYIDDVLVSTTNDIAIEWRAANTPEGSTVVVQPVLNELGAAPFTLTFDNVAAAGITTVRLLEAQEPRAPAPAGFLPATVGIVVREFSFEVGTTADYTGPIQVRFTVPGYNDSRGYVLCHFVDGAWQQIATDVEDGGLLLEGTVDSLSPFAVFMAEPPPFVGDGNVTARLKGRKLVLIGDAGDNYVVVEPGDGGPVSIRVLGVGTTVNGANDAVVFDNVRRLKIRTRTGNDEIHLDGGTQAMVFAGAVRIDAGAGNDVVAVLGVEARQAFTVATGAGDDSIDAIDCVFAQAATFNSRRGEDAIQFQRVSLALSLAINAGRNADLVTLRESILGTVPHPRRFRINGDKGADLLDAGLLDSPNAHDNQNVERLRIRRVEQNLT